MADSLDNGNRIDTIIIDISKAVLSVQYRSYSTVYMVTICSAYTGG